MEGNVRRSVDYCLAQCIHHALQDGVIGQQANDQPFRNSEWSSALVSSIKVQENVSLQGLSWECISVKHGKNSLAGCATNRNDISSRCTKTWRQSCQMACACPEKQSDFQNQVALNGSCFPTHQITNQAGYDLTSIHPSLSVPGEGNVHSGAVPPWLKHSDKSGEQASSDADKLQFLSRTQERRLRKMRNPRRVGAAWAEQRRAELEHEKHGEHSCGGAKIDANWLPNFGRVWQSGSRRESRKEFESEKRLERKQGRNLQTGESKLHPYVRKRQINLPP
eukprot:c20089_g1_i1 orf=403-1239(+)